MELKNKFYDLLNASEPGKYQEPFKPPLNLDFLKEEHEIAKKQKKDAEFNDSEDEYICKGRRYDKKLQIEPDLET